MSDDRKREFLSEMLRAQAKARRDSNAAYLAKQREARERRLGVAGLRALYVGGTIEAEEFEERLDALLLLDPAALDRKPLRPMTDAPGSVIPYNPKDGIPSYANAHGILQEIHRDRPTYRQMTEAQRARRAARLAPGVPRLDLSSPADRQRYLEAFIRFNKTS